MPLSAFDLKENVVLVDSRNAVLAAQAKVPACVTAEEKARAEQAVADAEEAHRRTMNLTEILKDQRMAARLEGACTWKQHA